MAAREKDLASAGAECGPPNFRPEHIIQKAFTFGLSFAMQLSRDALASTTLRSVTGKKLIYPYFGGIASAADSTDDA